MDTGAHERVWPSALLSPLCPQLSQSDMLQVEPALLQYPDWRGHLLYVGPVGQWFSPPGRFCFPGDMWQHLEVFGFCNLGEGVLLAFTG